MKVLIINKSRHQLPQYETPLSAGMDIRGDFSRIKLVDNKPEKFFFDADVVAISKIEEILLIEEFPVFPLLLLLK